MKDVSVLVIGVIVIMALGWFVVDATTDPPRDFKLRVEYQHDKDIDTLEVRNCYRVLLEKGDLVSVIPYRGVSERKVIACGVRSFEEIK